MDEQEKNEDEKRNRDVGIEEEKRQVEGFDEQEKNEDEKRNNRDVGIEEEKRQVKGFDEQETNCAKADYEVQSNNEVKNRETNEEKKSQVLEQRDEPSEHKEKSQSDEERNHGDVAKEEDRKRDDCSVGDVKLGKNDEDHVTDSESDESSAFEWKILIPHKTKSHKEYESEDDVPLALLKSDVYMGCINSTIDSEKESDVKELDVKRDSDFENSSDDDIPLSNVIENMNKITDTGRNNQSMEQFRLENQEQLDADLIKEAAVYLSANSQSQGDDLGSFSDTTFTGNDSDDQILVRNRKASK